MTVQIQTKTKQNTLKYKFLQQNKLQICCLISWHYSIESQEFPETSLGNRAYEDATKTIQDNSTQFNNGHKKLALLILKILVALQWDNTDMLILVR